MTVTGFFHLYQEVVVTSGLTAALKPLSSPLESRQQGWTLRQAVFQTSPALTAVPRLCRSLWPGAEQSGYLHTTHCAQPSPSSEVCRDSSVLCYILCWCSWVGAGLISLRLCYFPPYLCTELQWTLGATCFRTCTLPVLLKASWGLELTRDGTMKMCAQGKQQLQKAVWCCNSTLWLGDTLTCNAGVWWIQLFSPTHGQRSGAASLLHWNYKGLFNLEVN